MPTNCAKIGIKLWIISEKLKVNVKLLKIIEIIKV